MSETDAWSLLRLSIPDFLFKAILYAQITQIQIFQLKGRRTATSNIRQDCNKNLYLASET